jgi:hypothetical protein
LKHFFNVAVLDDRDPLVVIQKPLNDLGNRIEIDVAARVALQWRRVKGSFFLSSIAVI